MSGGHFDYVQYRIEDVAEEINSVVEEYKDDYPQEIIDRFKLAALYVKCAANMTQRIDWLLSCDDGEESFLRRWEEDVTPLLGKIKDGE